MAVRQIQVNAVNDPTTTHTYNPVSSGTGIGYGPMGHDESFSTYYGSSGAGSHTVIAQHDFVYPRTVTQLKYQLYTHGYAYGDDTASVSIEYSLQYTTNGTDWITITTAGA